MTGHAERSNTKKQLVRSKGRGWNSPNEQSNVGTPEAEPSWASWKTQAFEAEPSWTPWQAAMTGQADRSTKKDNPQDRKGEDGTAKEQ